MAKQNCMKLLCAVLLLSSQIKVAEAEQGHSFSIGPAVGVSVFLDSGKNRKGVNYGVVSRYAYTKANGSFWGLQGKFMGESAKGTNDRSILDLVTVGARAEAKWSAGLMGVYGRNFERFSPYVGLGLNLLSEKLVFLSPDGDIESESESNVAAGLKIAVGVNVPLGENLSGFAQGEYNNYDTLPFTGASNVIEFKVGILYRF